MKKVLSALLSGALMLGSVGLLGMYPTRKDALESKIEKAEEEIKKIQEKIGASNLKDLENLKLSLKEIDVGLFRLSHTDFDQDLLDRYSGREKDLKQYIKLVLSQINIAWLEKKIKELEVEPLDILMNKKIKFTQGALEGIQFEAVKKMNEVVLNLKEEAKKLIDKLENEIALVSKASEKFAINVEDKIYSFREKRISKEDFKKMRELILEAGKFKYDSWKIKIGKLLAEISGENILDQELEELNNTVIYALSTNLSEKEQNEIKKKIMRLEFRLSSLGFKGQKFVYAKVVRDLLYRGRLKSSQDRAKSLIQDIKYKTELNFENIKKEIDDIRRDINSLEQLHKRALRGKEAPAFFKMHRDIVTLLNEAENKINKQQ